MNTRIIVGWKRRDDKCKRIDCHYLGRCPYPPGECVKKQDEPVCASASEAARMIEEAWAADPPDHRLALRGLVRGIVILLLTLAFGMAFWLAWACFLKLVWR